MTATINPRELKGKVIAGKYKVHSNHDRMDVVHVLIISFVELNAGTSTLSKSHMLYVVGRGHSNRTYS